MSEKTEKIAKSILSRYDSLKGSRSNFNTLFQEAAELIFPLQQSFVTEHTEGTEQTDRIVDSTAPRALEMFAGILEHLLTPAHMKWHTLTINDKKLLDNNRDVRQYLEDLNNRLFELRYDPRANYASQMNSTYKSIGAFGTGTTLIDDGKPGFWYKSIPLATHFIDENYRGIIDSSYEEIKWTAKQAVEALGEDNVCEEILSAYENDQNDTKFRFVEAVYPNKNYVKDSKKITEAKFTVIIACEKSKDIVSQEYISEMNKPSARYSVAPNEIYGRGPGLQSLPDIKTLNAMDIKTLQAIDFALDPVMGMPNDGIISEEDWVPGGSVPGAIDENGRQLYVPLNAGANPIIGEEMKATRREAIREAFLVTLFQLLKQKPAEMTATQFIGESRERGILISPMIARIQNELITPMVEREVGIMLRSGYGPEMPDILKDKKIDIEYDTPLIKSMRATELSGIFNSLQMTSQFAQATQSPEIMDGYDPDETRKLIDELNSVPTSITRSDDDIAELRESRQQANAEAQAAQAAPQLANANKANAEADQINKEG